VGISIAGLGHYLPQKVVTNEELIGQLIEASGKDIDVAGLKKKLDLNLAVKRHFKSGEENGIQMARAAIWKCLEKSGATAADIDLIIYCAMYRKHVEPAMAIYLQDEIGAVNANAFDVSNACMGFLNAIELAYFYIEAGRYDHVLIVGAEENSELIPMDMFGGEVNNPGFSSLTIADGAAAMLLRKGPRKKDFGLFDMHTYCEHKDVCKIRIGKETHDLKLMVNSRKLAAVALNVMSKFIPAFVALAEDYLGGVDIMFIHQVTGNQKKFCGGLSDELFNKFYTTFPVVGNTGSVSVPLAMSLAEEEGRLKRGDRVVLLVGASGFSCGGTAFVY
jgi:3-oxoacyl-[acyl-carrier-protein] synthase-3